MLEIYAPAYVNVGILIHSIAENISASLVPEDRVSEDDLKALQQVVRGVSDLAHEIELPVCINVAGQLLRAYSASTPSYRQAKADILNLQKVLEAELRSRLFFFVPWERSRYYSRPMDPSVDHVPGLDGLAEKLEPFRPALDAFPSIEDDLRDAGNCLALGCSTAAVFHIMRVLEIGLKILSKAVGVPYEHNWGACLKAMDKEVQRSGDPFFSEAIAHLRTVKTTWRNPTMHVERRYDYAQAEAILSAAMVFMRHLATSLAE